MCPHCASPWPRSTRPWATSTPNAALIVETMREAADRGAHLVVFPEMCLTGYPVEDLAFRRAFIDASRASVRALASTLDNEGLGNIVVVVGYPRRGRGPPAGPGVPKKCTAEPGRKCCMTARSWSRRPNTTSGTTVSATRSGTSCRRHNQRRPGARRRRRDRDCEDLWQDGPTEAVRAAEAGLLIVPNGSPYERNKDDVRLALCANRARESGCSLAYVNLVGGQDELVFDGDSIVVDAAGELIARSAQFETRCWSSTLTCLLQRRLCRARPAIPRAQHRADGAQRLAVAGL